MPNNFANDPNLVSLFRFEPGALGKDSKGPLFLRATGAVTSHTTNHKEGSGCADFESGSSQFLSVPNDNELPWNFPARYGTTPDKVSICGWVRLESLPAEGQSFCVCAKWDSTLSRRSFAVWISTAGGVTSFDAGIGYSNGTAYEAAGVHASALSTDTNYWFCWTFDDSTNAYTLRVKDNSGNTVGTDVTGSTTNDMSVRQAGFIIGSQYENNPSVIYPFDGLIDELAVFNDVITSAEATAIAQASYGAQLAQHSFRFVNDDGSESGSTFKDALNTNVNMSAGDKARIRFLIDATGDDHGSIFVLQARRKPAGGSFGDWSEVESLGR